MSTDPAAYQLDTATLERIFQRQILDDLVDDLQRPAERPEVILLGGQPGAGKTSSHGRFIREFAQREGLVVVATDTLRTYHPGLLHVWVTTDLPGCVCRAGRMLPCPSPIPASSATMS